MGSEPWTTAPVPRATVGAVRAQLGSLVDATLTAVRAENPGYREILGSPEGLGIRLGIEQAINSFLDAIERGERPPLETGEVWRRLGEAEFQAGRSLEALRGAFRSGTRAVWRNAAGLASEAGVSAHEVIALAEGIFVYTDELAADVVEGYLQAKSDEAGERERRRRRLAALLLDPDHHDIEAIERAADLARWTVPRNLAVLAFAGDAPIAIAPKLDPDALLGADARGGWIVLGDPDGPGRQPALNRALSRALDGISAALGPTVAPREAHRSLRWARLTLSLIERGALVADQAPAHSSDHLATLVLLQDAELADELAQPPRPADPGSPGRSRAAARDARGMARAPAPHPDDRKGAPRPSADGPLPPRDPARAVRRRTRDPGGAVRAAAGATRGARPRGVASRPHRYRKGARMTEATKTRKSPNGQAAVRSGPVADRVAKLREQSRDDAVGAREDAWEWIKELSKRAKSDREGALAELQEIFLCGRPAESVSGQTEGILVTWTMHPLADKLIGTITDGWMPWVGKKFDTAQKRGINTLTNSARWPAKVLWPLYGSKPAPLGREAFEFNTYVEAGKLDPEVDVLVIDYESVKTNPDLLIRQIRDELVEIVPGANLGKMLVDVPRRSELFPALYFALKSEL